MFEENRDNLIIRLANYLERDFEPKNLLTLLGFGFFGNAICWIIAVFGSDSIAKVFSFLTDLSDKVANYLLIFPFFFGFLIGFSICKFLYRKKDKPIVSDTEFLSGYSEHLVRENLRRIFLISAMIGAINTILLLVSTLWFR